MRLRVKDGKSAQLYTLTVEDDSNYHSFIEKLKETVGNSGHFILKFGTPPFKKIECTDPLSTKLSDLSIRNGDSLIFEQETSTPKETPISADQQGSFVIRKIDDDNSCLFNSIGYLLMNHSLKQSSHLRNIVVETVMANPIQFNDAFLGYPVSEYCRIIKGANSWGGAIELAILSQHFKTEIVSIDVETLKPYRFGEDAGYKERVFIVYSGIHYDAIALSPFKNAPKEMDITIFPTTDDMAFVQALSIVEIEQKAKRFTNLNTFTLKCTICNTALKGQVDAQEHAKGTGHTSFSEY